MVRPSKSKAESAPNPSPAYDLTSVSTALEEVDKDLAPAAYDMSGLSEALNEAERRRKVSSKIRMRAILAAFKKPIPRRVRYRPPVAVEDLMILHRKRVELRWKAMQVLMILYRNRVEPTRKAMDDSKRTGVIIKSSMSET